MIYVIYILLEFLYYFEGLLLDSDSLREIGKMVAGEGMICYKYVGVNFFHIKSQSRLIPLD